MDIEKAVEFILQSQAQFASDMLRLERGQAETDARLNKLTQHLDDIADVQLQLMKSHEQLLQSQINLTDQMRALIQRVERFMPST